MTPPIIGFIGPMRSGKTTIAQALLDHPRHTHLRVMHFADPIKACLRSIGVTKEGTPSLFRQLAQTIGQTCRNADPNWWVNRFDVQYTSPEDQTSKVEWLRDYRFRTGKGLRDAMAAWDSTAHTPCTLIDDVRYANEIEWVRGQGGVLVFVDAYDRIDLSQEERQHESELISNILHGELAEAHHVRADFHQVYSPYLGEKVWVARNLDGQTADLAALISTTLGL